MTVGGNGFKAILLRLPNGSPRLIGGGKCSLTAKFIAVQTRSDEIRFGSYRLLSGVFLVLLLLFFREY